MKKKTVGPRESTERIPRELLKEEYDALDDRTKQSLKLWLKETLLGLALSGANYVMFY